MNLPLWTGRCTSRGVTVLGGGIGLITVAAGFLLLAILQSVRLVGWLVIGLGIVVAIAVAISARLRVTVDVDGFTVRWGPGPWPRRRLSWESVRAASAIQVEPLDWGGWGYRWVPWARTTTAVVRRGPGIKLDLVDGRTFVVTVDDAVEGAKACERARDHAEGQA